MKITLSSGGVVLNKNGQVLVVSQRGQSWSLPKGHIDPGEDSLTAAKREIYEESGVPVADLRLIRELGTYERPKTTSLSEAPEIKRLTFYLFQALSEALQPIDPHNPEARWVDKNQVAMLLTHPKDKEFFNRILPEL